MTISGELQIRSVRVQDARAIVELIRRSSAAAILNMTIYGCSGIERFVAELITEGADITDTFHLVAGRGDIISSCLEMRFAPDTLHLNHIFTAEGSRRGGQGLRVLAAAIQAVRRPQHTRMTLDVFADNHLARSWYERLGFTVQHVNGWWSMPLRDVPGNSTGRVCGWPQSRVCQAAYCFSQVTVFTRDGSYTIGLLGDTWFRVTDSGILDDPEALATLRRIDPNRRLLALLREDTLKGALLPKDATRHQTSLRMAVDLDTLGGHLS